MSGTRWTASELMAAEFPPPRWAVDEIIPEGLTLVCAGPKFGKSWLGLGLGVAIAKGGHAFGRVPVKQGDALVLALEDTAPRLQTRLRMLTGDESPDSLHIWTTWEGIEELDVWLSAHPECRYVCIDVLKKVRGHALKAESVYEGDYRALEPFKELADRHRVAIVVLHHVRKMASEDFLDTVSGSHGLAGSADTVVVMSRSRMTSNAVMKITSREVAESERALNFDAATGQWILLDGPALLHEVGDTRKAVLTALAEAGKPMKPSEVARVTRLDAELIKKTMQRMADDDQLHRAGAGTYVPLSLQSPESPVPHRGDIRDAGDIGTDPWLAAFG